MRHRVIPLLTSVLLMNPMMGFGADQPTWTTLPIPKDAVQVDARLFPVDAPPTKQWIRTQFKLRRSHPDDAFLKDLDSALGQQWRYCGGWPEGWHNSEVEPGVKIAAGNWCNPSSNRTMSAVVEYPGHRKSNYGKRDKRVQDISVWEDEHPNPCAYLESGTLNCETPRPGG
jgi:hypothetical protein